MPAHSLNPRAGPFHTPLPAYDYYSKTTKKIFILSALCERIILAAIPKKYPVGKNRRVYRTLLVWFEREKCEDVVLSSRGWKMGTRPTAKEKRSCVLSSNGVQGMKSGYADDNVLFVCHTIDCRAPFFYFRLPFS
jgi:hypothetical protein